MSGNRRGGAGLGMGKESYKVGFGSMLRALRIFRDHNRGMFAIVMVCIVVAAAIESIPSIFTQKIFSIIEVWVETGNYEGARPELMTYIGILIALYVTALLFSLLQTQLMAFMTQGFLDDLRKKLFGNMQKLPIRYFDTHKHGDIMSHYTNDIDTLRQLVSQAFPSLVQSVITVIGLIAVMLWFSLWMTLVLLAGVVLMIFITGKVGKGSSKFFIRQQRAVAATEGFVQEMITGQKVVKIFNHEKDGIEDFNKLNDALYEDSWRAHAYANILAPIINNVGNITYVALAFAGGIFLITNVPNVSISGEAFALSLMIPFLNMAKQFTGKINQLTMQMNAVVMAGAGAQRVFALIDEKPETDDGYVTLVNAKIDKDGNITETDERTGRWAWKHPHKAEGTITYTELKGDVRLTEVDFAYEEGKDVLHDITLFAEPGQKVAFVGATGAGKTTITNLINRFYDIADGKIRYDGINVNKIKKGDLRRSLGLVLQETNLFTGTVMDNIRYGRLEATDDECREAARLAGADDFIERLPEGYDTMLTNNGANLSQGQRQHISIARAAVANPPVMILDEATSSIDTRTEAIVQRGMDKLMEGRTVFVIAHRLSTVMNSDVIMVLDHGRIIERGNHDKLISEKGVYYKLYTGAFELE